MTRNTVFAYKALQAGTGLRDCHFLSSTQYKSMVGVVIRTADLLIVDRTGGKKTVLFAGPARLESGVTVVVVPLKALGLDVVSRLKKLGISVTLVCGWEESNRIPMNGVLLAIPEDVSKTEFKHLCSRLYALNRLIRIVRDVAHETVLASGLRESMASLRPIRGNMNIPLILLSATVPSCIELAVLEAHGMSAATTQIILGDLSRDNIGLEVVHLESGSREYLYDKV